MKFYYPKDMKGNIIGFKTPESQVYDKNGKSLTDKLDEIHSKLGNAENIQGYTPSTGGLQGLATILNDYGVTKIGSSIEFHTKDKQIPTRLRLDGTGDIHVDNTYIKDASLFLYQNRTDSETDINTLISTSIYRCTNFINFPERHPDGQGTVIVLNYSGNGSIASTNIMGENNMWVTQIFISAHSYAMWKRYITGVYISPWISCSVEELVVYDDIDILPFAEDPSICPDYTTSKFRLWHPLNVPILNSDYIIEVFKISADVIKITAHHMHGQEMWTKQKIDGIWHEWKEIQTVSIPE